MLLGREKIYSYDRYIPSRAFINFDAAYYNFFYKHWDSQNENEFSNLPYQPGRAEFRKNLENLANFDQRLFKTAAQNNNKTHDFESDIWPCVPRKKPCLTRERILDLPEFNKGSHLTNIIDWGPRDIIVTSVMGKIIIGSGFSGKSVSTEIVTEYENDVGTAVSWSSNGACLAVGTESGLVQIWNMSRKKIVMEEKCCGDKACTITTLQWHPMQHSLSWGCTNGKITRRDFRDQVTTEVLNAHDGFITNLKYSPKANYLCSCGQDGYVRIWRGDSYEPFMEIEMSNPVRAVAWHPWRSGILAVGEGLSATVSLSVWNVSTTKLKHMRMSTEPVAIKALEFNKLSGELVCSQWVSRDDKEQCEIVVLRGPDYVMDIAEEKTGCVTSLLWNSDGTKLGTAGTDETFKIWKFLEDRKETCKKRNKNYGLRAFSECHLTVR